ncbi:MAG: YqgE/AlgH family protein [Alphaproteobacteria bacterium]|nr:YqgE/AlgH family protein [Alphaproteobacteria bacterium]
MAEASGDTLTGQLLIAMPTMGDQRFAKSVVYICAHSAEGAMGIVVNKLINFLTFPDLLTQLGIKAAQPANQINIHFGGPVETSRGFVLHSAEYRRDETLVVNDRIGLTATIDVVRAMAEGRGPRRSLVALGYAGWAPGQLDSEIQANGWLHAPADEELVFDPDQGRKWTRSAAKVGVEFSMLSSFSGRA